MVGMSVYLLVGWSERFVKKWLLEYQIVIKTYFLSNVTVVTVVTVLTVFTEVTFFGNAGLLYWELTLPIYICRCNIMYDTLIVKSLFTSPGWSKNDIIWKSLGCRVVNGVPKGSPAAFGSWPWDFPKDSIHHSTTSAFPNNVPVVTVGTVVTFVTTKITEKITQKTCIRATLGPLICVWFRSTDSIPQAINTMAKVLSIPWFQIYTLSPCKYHESMSIPWILAHAMTIPWFRSNTMGVVNTMSLSKYHGYCQYHEIMSIPWVLVSFRRYLKIKEVPKDPRGI